MSFFNHEKKEINIKIVYYGPGLVGKRTNMDYIYKRTKPNLKGKMVSLATETERTIFFDFLPQTLEKVHGFDCRLHLYTVPGPVFYDTSRQLILKGVGGVVFVADSQIAREESNLDMLENLERNLEFNGFDIDEIPLVFQYNKRDLPDILSVADLDKRLNLGGREHFEAIANKGVGVVETLNAIGRQVVQREQSQ